MIIESDARIREAMKSLTDRPRLPLRVYVRDVRTLMEQVPEVRVGHDRHAMEESRIELGRMRSRIAAIKRECLREVGQLRNVRKGLVDWVYSRYAGALKQAGNDHARSGLIGHAVAPLDERIGEVQVVLDMVEVALQDYDSRAFGFRDVVAALRIGDRGD